MADDKPSPPVDENSGVSRRDFLKLGGITLTVPMVVGPRVVEVGGKPVEIHGPGKVPITLSVNGKRLGVELEPRVTLLDALRDHLKLTGAKRVCDRGECGACTVLMNGRPVYACQVLAIDAQGVPITTVELLSTPEPAPTGAMANPGLPPEKLHPIQQAFVDNDAQQCGFCTPGFVMAAKAVLDRHPRPTPQQVLDGLSGNLCRCGTYRGLRAAVMVAGGQQVPPEWATLARVTDGDGVPRLAPNSMARTWGTQAGSDDGEEGGGDA
ncbi:MAG: 2Fe-2S iron-sulfur cluster-binding protein [Terriglobales bacterium]